MGASKSVLKKLEKSATCQIALQLQTVMAGQYCAGYVNLHVNNPIQCERIYIDMIGKIKSSVRYYTGSGEHRRIVEAKEERTLYSVRMVAAEYPNEEVPPNQYQIPFQFQVPSDAPPDGRVSYPSPCSSWAGDDSASTTHMVCVGVQVKGKIYYIQSTPFSVSPILLHGIHSGMVEDVQKVNFCCCFSKGSMRLAAKTTKNAYVKNEPATVIYEVNNDSTKDVEAVFIELISTTTIYAENEESNHTKTLSQTKCGRVAKHTGFGSRAIEPSPALQVQLIVPPVISSSRSTPLLKLGYIIRLTAVTGICTTNPKVEIPVTIYEGMKATAIAMPAPDSAGSFGMPLIQAIPYTPDVTIQRRSSIFQPTNPALMNPIPVDLTGNGVADCFGYDTSGDGKVDSLDTNGLHS